MDAIQAVSFFVGAHPDDWQLFAGNQARDDFRFPARVVFVYLTAGDAGETDGWWQAREAGAVASTLLLGPESAAEPDTPIFLGRKICRWKSDRTASYFLRLPDNSLTDFKNGKRDASPVDGTTTYPDWKSLVLLVESILDFESGSYLSNKPWINTSDYLKDSFPIEGVWMDNLDHYATGDVARMISPGKYRVSYWSGYNETRRKNPVSAEDLSFKQSLMIEYSRVVLERYKKEGDYEDDKPGYDGFMRYTYTRQE